MFCDADYAGDKETRRSTSGMIVMMNGGSISWSSRLQKLVALPSAESEIYAFADSVKEALHVKLMCEDCGLREPGIPTGGGTGPGLARTRPGPGPAFSCFYENRARPGSAEKRTRPGPGRRVLLSKQPGRARVNPVLLSC